MKITSASFDTVILRFYFMMVIVIGSFVIGYPALAILAVPVFLSALAGVSFKKEKTETQYQSKQVKMNYTKSTANAA
jgi:hypothetical protein